MTFFLNCRYGLCLGDFNMKKIALPITQDDDYFIITRPIIVLFGRVDNNVYIGLPV